MSIVYITRRIPHAGIALLDDYDLRIGESDMPPSREEIMRQIADAEGIITLVTDTIDGDIMDAAPRLKVISNMAVGYDNIDIDAATRRGIPVGNTPGVLTETTADLAFALLLSAARRIVEGERYVQAGEWRTWMPDLLLGQDIHDATLGIVGFGRIGQAVARRARGFNMRILFHGGSDDTAVQQIGAEQVGLNDLLAQSDFVSLHTPLNDATYHMIGECELKRMKRTAILVNTARGGVVDTVALYHALKDGEIAYAALDVTEPEPIQMDDPLLDLDNCLIVPHLGSSSVATRDKMATLAARNLLAGLRGDPLPHPVNVP